MKVNKFDKSKAKIIMQPELQAVYQIINGDLDENNFNRANHPLSEAPNYVTEAFYNILHTVISEDPKVIEDVFLNLYDVFRGRVSKMSPYHVCSGCNPNIRYYQYADIIYAEYYETKTVVDGLMLIKYIEELRKKSKRCRKLETVNTKYKENVRVYVYYVYGGIQTRNNSVAHLSIDLTDKFEEQIKQKYDIKNVFTDDVILKSIQKIKDKIAEVIGAENNRYVAAQIASYFQSDQDNEIDKQLYHYQIGLPDSEFIYYYLALYKIYLSGYEEIVGQKRFIMIINNAVNNYCLSSILSYYRMRMTANNKNVNNEEDEFDENHKENKHCINKFIREYDAKRFASECILSVCMALMVEGNKELTQDRIDLLGRNKDVDVAKHTEQRKAKTIAGKDEKIKELNGKIAALTLKLEKAEELNKKPEDKEGKKAVQKLRHEISGLKKNVTSKERQIEELKNKISAYDELDRIKEEIVDPEKIEIDPEVFHKKILFVCQRDNINNVLRKAFPNSVFSEEYELTENNSKKVDVVVFIVKEVAHDEYYRVKSKARAQNVKIVYASCKNTDLIAMAISEELNK